MRIKQWIIYTLVLFIYVILDINIHMGNDISELYLGVPCKGSIIPLFIEFFGFSIFALCNFGESYSFVHNEGLYIIIREKSRPKIYLRIIKNTILRVSGLETIKLFLYFVVFILKGYTYENIEIFNIIPLYLTEIFVFSAICILQSELELILDEKLGFLFILSYYILSIQIGTILYSSKLSHVFFALLLPNLSMTIRNSMIEQRNLVLFIAVCIQIIINALVWLKIKRKDLV